MSDETVSVTDGSVTVSSNTETEAQIRAALAPQDPEPVKTDAPAEPAPEAPVEPSQDSAAQERGENGQFKTKSTKAKDNPVVRMQQATANEAAAKRDAEQARQETAEIRQRLEALERPKAPEKPVTPPALQYTRPKPEQKDFDHEGDPYSAWIDALGDWKLEQFVAGQERERQQREQREKDVAASARIAKGRETYPDLDEKIQAADGAMRAAGFRHPLNGQAQWPPVVLDAIMGSEHSSDLVHYLGSHPEECVQLARELASLPASAATVVRRVFERLLTPTSPVDVSTGPSAAVLPRPAASPIAPVRSGAVAVSGGPPGENATPFEHAQYYNRLEREAKSRRA